MGGSSSHAAKPFSGNSVLTIEYFGRPLGARGAAHGTGYQHCQRYQPIRESPFARPSFRTSLVSPPAAPGYPVFDRSLQFALRHLRLLAAWPDDVTLESVERLLPSLAQLHTQVVLLSGGEPLLNPEWGPIAERLRANGQKVWLLTSGLSLAKHAGRAAESFDAITVSLDGTDSQTYAAIRGLDAFDKVCEGIRAAAGNGVPPGIRVTLQRANFRQLPAFLRSRERAWRFPDILSRGGRGQSACVRPHRPMILPPTSRCVRRTCRCSRECCALWSGAMRRTFAPVSSPKARRSCGVFCNISRPSAAKDRTRRFAATPRNSRR